LRFGWGSHKNRTFMTIYGYVLRHAGTFLCTYVFFLTFSNLGNISFLWFCCHRVDKLLSVQFNWISSKLILHMLECIFYVGNSTRMINCSFYFCHFFNPFLHPSPVRTYPYERMCNSEMSAKHTWKRGRETRVRKRFSECQFQIKRSFRCPCAARSCGGEISNSFWYVISIWGPRRAM
jgi:hypothetical protein